MSVSESSKVLPKTPPIVENSEEKKTWRLLLRVSPPTKSKFEATATNKNDNTKFPESLSRALFSKSPMKIVGLFWNWKILGSVLETGDALKYERVLLISRRGASSNGRRFINEMYLTAMISLFLS